MKWIIPAALVALLAGTAPVAIATVGGPKLCDVLGWDAAEKRIYVHLQPQDAGDSFGTVAYFALGAADPHVLTAVEWSRSGENTGHDAGLQRRLATLRRGLRPLERTTARALPWQSVVRRDSVAELFDAPRFRVELSFEREHDYDATTFYSPAVARIALLAIPGRTERLAVFSFTGDPAEGGYETQEPVLVVTGETGARAIGRRSVAP